MKNFRIVLILVLGSLMVFNSCKRGAEDPFLSFKSRDARITGEWLITDITGSSTQYVRYLQEPFAGNSEREVINYSFSGYIMNQTITTTTVFDGQSTTNTDIYTIYRNETVTIDKDGTVTVVRSYEDGEVTSETGRWYWTNNNKKKIGIAFDVDGDYTAFDIIQLKDKEIILQMKEQSSYSSDYSSETYDFEINYTYEKQ